MLYLVYNQNISCNVIYFLHVISTSEQVYVSEQFEIFNKMVCFYCISKFCSLFKLQYAEFYKLAKHSKLQSKYVGHVIFVFNSEKEVFPKKNRT